MLDDKFGTNKKGAFNVFIKYRESNINFYTI